MGIELLDTIETKSKIKSLRAMKQLHLSKDTATIAVCFDPYRTECMMNLYHFTIPSFKTQVKQQVKKKAKTTIGTVGLPPRVQVAPKRPKKRQ